MSHPQTPGNRRERERELELLRERCRRQEHEIDALHETIALFRSATSALSRENADLRVEAGRHSTHAHEARARNGRRRSVVCVPRDARAPATARAAVAELLHGRVALEVFERAGQIAAELMDDSLYRTAAPSDQPLTLRVEHSLAAVHIEVEDPSPGGALPFRPAGPDDLVAFGLSFTHILSESRGTDHAAHGGTRAWALLTFDTQLAAPTDP